MFKKPVFYPRPSTIDHRLVSEALTARAEKARQQAIDLLARLNDPSKFFSQHNLLKIHQEAVSYEICALVLDVKADTLSQRIL